MCGVERPERPAAPRWNLVILGKNWQNLLKSTHFCQKMTKNGQSAPTDLRALRRPWFIVTPKKRHFRGFLTIFLKNFTNFWIFCQIFWIFLSKMVILPRFFTGVTINVSAYSVKKRDYKRDLLYICSRVIVKWPT